MRLLILPVIASLAMLAAPLTANAVMLASSSTHTCLNNSGGSATLAPCGSGQDATIPYDASSNSFYGTLKLGGQCLDVTGGTRVVFAACNGGQGQIWKYGGSSGQLNNQAGYCIIGSGSVSVAKCPQNYTWSNETFAPHVLPTNATKGTVYTVKGAVLVGPNGTTVPAPASLIGHDGSSVVASGGGNAVSGSDAARIVASGGGN